MKVKTTSHSKAFQSVGGVASLQRNIDSSLSLSFDSQTVEKKQHYLEPVHSKLKTLPAEVPSHPIKNDKSMFGVWGELRIKLLMGMGLNSIVRSVARQHFTLSCGASRKHGKGKTCCLRSVRRSDGNNKVMPVTKYGFRVGKIHVCELRNRVAKSATAKLNSMPESGRI